MYFNRRIDEVMAEFGTGPDGLTEAQVAENLEKYGPNKLYEKKKKSVFAVFLSQFKDLLVIILIIAAMISMATGNVESTVVILAVLILNAILCCQPGTRGFPSRLHGQTSPGFSGPKASGETTQRLTSKTYILQLVLQERFYQWTTNIRLTPAVRS